MTDNLSMMLPLFLRSKDALSDDEIRKIKEAYEREGRDSVEAFLRKEKSNVPFASYLLSELGIDANYWKRQHKTYVDRNEQILALVDRVFDDYYQKGGKSLCVYENFGAMLSSGISIGCFASNDVDVTADIEEKEFLKEVFAENGFILNQRGAHPIDNKQISTFHNPDALGGSGWWLNVMWQTTSRAYMVNQKRYNKRLSIERNNGELYKNTSIRMLEPTAMAYFCALHIAIEHFFSASPGMSLYCDVDRVIRFRSIEWGKIANWISEDLAGNRITLVMDVSNRCLQTPIPKELLKKSSSIYQKLRDMVVDEKTHSLKPQLGKFKRLEVELLSDNKTLISSLINRIICH